MSKIEPCALTPAQSKAWDMTRTALSWHCPGFIHIFYTMCDNAGVKEVALFTKEVPIAATDGLNLLLNPDTFFKYNNSERVFICCHEIMHCVWDHCGQMHKFMRTGKIVYQDGTTLPYDQQTMNIATDLVINDMLIEAKVGTFNKDWLHDPSVATANDSAIDAYKKVYQANPPGKGGKPGGNGPKGSSFDEHMAPGTSQGKSPDQAIAARDDIEWKTNVAAATKAEIESNSRKQGSVAGAFQRFLGEILEPKVSWREHIQGLMARKLGTGSWNWQSPDSQLIYRDIYAPSRSGYGCGTVVVGCDTSGSIGPKELDMFFAEMAGILEDAKPKQLVILWCDAKVHRVDDCEEVGDLNTIRAMGAPGGGGTSFIPVFDEIDKLGLRPEALVYLTDGCGSFPNTAPSYPVIWANIYPPMKDKYPFGDVVEVPKQAA
jgi:predicted metal-dependent peptidase